MEIKDIKEVSDIAKHIKDLTEQIKNQTREGMEKVIISVRNHLLLQTELYEDSLCVINNGIKVTIGIIEDNVLYGKLKDYKMICLNYLLQKYGKEVYNEIIKEYGLEV